MRAVMLLLVAGMVTQDRQEDRIRDLVRDLGSQEYKIREKADKELLKLGKAAIPALKEAAEDKDAERAMRARSLLKRIEVARKAEESRRRADGVRVVVKDTDRGITFRREPDGRMELTVPEKDSKSGKRKYRTYKADSIEEFKKKYPELAKKYDVESFLPRPLPRWSVPLLRNDDRTDDLWKRFRGPFGDDNWWRDWLKAFENDEKDPFTWMDKWLKRQLKPLENRGRHATFGLWIAPVDETTRSQLDLEKDVGIQVVRVAEDSLAGKAGVKKHDILTKLNGKDIDNRWHFRRDIREALTSERFTVEVLRGGKRRTIEVKP